MKGVVKAEQFDPNAPYPENTWCHGPGAFYCSTHRGHAHIGKGDWIVTFATGEIIPVAADTYEQFFKEPDLVQEAEVIAEKLSVAQEQEPGLEAHTALKSRQSSKAK